MNTRNGSLTVHFTGDTINLTARNDDTATVVTTGMDADEAKTLRAMLEEALIGVEDGSEYVTYPRMQQ